MKALKSIPAAPQGLPFVGHLVPLLRDPLVFLTSLPAHGDLVRIRLGPFTLIVICHPELTRQALVDDRTFDKGGLLYDRAREVMGDGLGTCPHSEHRRLRRLAQPAFHPARFPAYGQAMTACLDQVTGSWQTNQTLDVPTEMMSITCKVTAATLFSSALPPADLSQLLNDIKTVFDGIYQRMFLIPPLDRAPTRNNRTYRDARTRLHDTLDGIVHQRRTDGSDRGDLLSALVAAHDAEDAGSGMTDAEISDTIVTFFLAGTETTASAVAWALDLLARHPEIERRLHAEVDAVLQGAPATHADLPRLELTERIITETLRLRPPGWFFTRKTTGETRLGGHTLPVGANVVYSPFIIHHRPDLYDNPETFDPDRWDRNRTQPLRHSFLPFATGARKCIGDTFAMAQATLALATISARWRLEHISGRQVRPALGTVLRPRELHMQTRPRTATHTKP
ncbi:cytochrome P450 [Streptomyces noursei]|uniref:cytochrome P450 n=1 Tax=Streptomyces noursei TaxID=1971 RepID=UPI0016783314|nr:cytochrome P450 [Streptomyces noursei]MCZ1014125.1 cytochrome P450 [Streptomyces noursei]